MAVSLNLRVNALTILSVFADLIPEIGPGSGGAEGKEDAIAHGEFLDLHFAHWTSLQIRLRHSNRDVKESGARFQHSRH